MKIRVLASITVEAPDGATHYAGDLLDGPMWFKRSRNGTGTHDGWSYYRPYDGAWYIETSTPEVPHWVKAIDKLLAFTSVREDEALSIQSVEVLDGAAPSGT